MAALPKLAERRDRKIAQAPDELLAVEKRVASDLQNKRRELDATTAEIAATTTQNYLNGLDLPDVTAPLRLRAEIDALDATLDDVRAARREAIEATYKATATAKREQAQQLRRDAERTRASAAKLLEELARVEGCPYQTGVAGVTVEGLAVHRTPLSARLENEARAIEQQANEQSQRPAADHGMAEADSVEELVVIVTGDALNLAPRLDSIVTWAADAEAAARAAYRKAHTGDEPSSVLFHVEWERGKLALSRCRVETPPDPETASRPPSTF